MNGQNVVVVLTGAVYTGKTSLAGALAASSECSVLRVRTIIEDSVGQGALPRADLQSAGLVLDERTQGRWIADSVGAAIGGGAATVVIDAVRTRRQLEKLRETVSAGLVVVHLTASDEERQRRLDRSRTTDPTDEAYALLSRIMAHPTDREADLLRLEADLVIDTTTLTPGAVCALVEAHLGGLN
jgi:hypothetical protein